MAIGRGGKANVAKSTGYLSDDSDFYGTSYPSPT